MAGALQIAVAVLSGTLLLGTLAEDPKSLQIQAEYARESNLKKRAKLAMQLVQERIKQLSAAYSTEVSGSPNEQIATCLAALDLLESAVSKAANPGVFKNAEQHLRRQIHDLENLKMNVSALERPDLEKVQTRLVSLRQKFLYSIMNPQRESAKK